MMIDVVIHDVDEIKLRCLLHKLMITDKLVIKHVRGHNFDFFFQLLSIWVDALTR